MSIISADSIKNNGKRRRFNKLLAKKQEQHDRLMLMRTKPDGTQERSPASLLLEKVISERAGAVYYQAAGKTKVFRPFYVKNEALRIPVLVKHDRHKAPVFSSKIVAYLTSPKLDKAGAGIPRPVPTFKDGTPRFATDASNSNSSSNIKENSNG